METLLTAVTPWSASSLASSSSVMLPNSPLRMTPFLLFRELCGVISTGILMKVVDFSNLSACNLQVTSTRIIPERSFFTVFGSPARHLIALHTAKGDMFSRL